MRAIVSALAATLLLAGCDEDPDKPYLAYAGGGFVFNYRVADHYYGFVAKPLRPLPDGAIIEAEFEVPGENNTFVVREKATFGRMQYMFRTPPLRGIVKDKPYATTLRLVSANGEELARYTRSYHSDVDQASLPDKPLVIGPGYTFNPELPLPPGAKSD
jgi:hypothetical protein